METEKRCLIEDCPHPSNVPGAARGWCRSHYRRWQRYGSPTVPLRRKSTYSGAKCSHEGCDRAARSHGKCMKHHMRDVRAGSAEGICEHGDCRKTADYGKFCGLHSPETLKNPDAIEAFCETCDTSGIDPKLRTNYESRWFHFCSPVCRMQWRVANGIPFSSQTSARFLTKADRAAYGSCCVICGEDRVLDFGHKDPARNGGGIGPENIYVLCPTHHRILDNCPERFTDEEREKLLTVDEVWTTKHPCWGTSSSRQPGLF